jgi:hypothetical protein
MMSSIFWDIKRRIPLKIANAYEEYFVSIFTVEEKAKQGTSVQLVASRAFLAYASTLKMEKTCSYETSADF